MRLQLSNVDDSLLLPGWTYNVSAFKKRSGIQQRFGQDGAWISGDQKISSRTLTLNHEIAAVSDTDYDAQIAAITAILYDDLSPFYFSDLDAGMRALVELDSINPTWQKGLEKRLASIQISLIMLDAYFENINVSTQNWTGATPNSTFNINNVSAVDVYPIITITPAANNLLFSIVNQTTQDSISISSAAFVPGTTITIDSQLGTVYLDDGITQTEISSAVGDGTGFFYLDRGNNVLQYQSLYGNADIVITYRPRYAF